NSNKPSISTTPHKTPTKDFFEADDSSNSWDAHAREYIQRKRGMNPTNKMASKPFVRGDRRFDVDNNDLFKTKSNFESFDTFDLMDDRDLFGALRFDNLSGSPPNYNSDLFSGGGSARGKHPPGGG